MLRFKPPIFLFGISLIWYDEVTFAFSQISFAVCFTAALNLAELTLVTAFRFLFNTLHIVNSKMRT